MRLSPLEIKKQDFSRAFRGYDAEEVHAFLQMVAKQWDEMQEENRHLGDQIRQLQGKIEHYEKVEEALQEALHTTRENARKTQEQAERQAAILVKEAELQAHQIVRDAERERNQLKQDLSRLGSRREEITARLRAFLMSEMELLARFEGNDPVGFIKLLPGGDREEKPAGTGRGVLMPARGDQPPAREPGAPENGVLRGTETPGPAEGPPAAPPEARPAAPPARPAEPAEPARENPASGAPARAAVGSPDELARIRRILEDLD